MPTTMELTEHSLQDIRRVRSRTGPDARREPREALDKATIAELSHRRLEQMTRDELIRLIRASELPILRCRDDERLEYLDRRTLLRGAHLARRCCRNQGY